MSTERHAEFFKVSSSALSMDNIAKFYDWSTVT